MTRYVIEGARVFDGEELIGVRTVEVEGARIVAVGAPAPAAAERVDGSGAILLPGLIDAHTHADLEALGFALRFGVTADGRGRITPGARADPLLVDGDPTSRIADTLSIRGVWRSGSRTAR